MLKIKTFQAASRQKIETVSTKPYQKITVYVVLRGARSNDEYVRYSRIVFFEVAERCPAKNHQIAVRFRRKSTKK